ncbi:MAG: hypothetical protein JSW39_30115 [Desulfobacterales bacterium]|nr:MAG: hypothetical protein JSW39_30115 [Desulfobacterales bacterium]
MKRTVIVGMAVALILSAGVGFAEAPHGVGGFVLNKNIKDFADQVILETALPIRYLESVEEVEIKPLEGIKSGLIAYGTCAAPGKIVRIKLKYDDASKRFFEKLLKLTKERFGEPDEYRGDPFHILIAWKWSFTDEDNNRISLILQHNAMDEEEKLGNAIKLTMTNLVEDDQRCYKEKQLDPREGLRGQKWEPKNQELSGWDLFIPR